MAEMGAHSALSGAIAIAVYQTDLGLTEKTIVVALISAVGHFILDLFPHGHTFEKPWKEFISSIFIVPIVLFLSFSKGGAGLFFLSCISLFFGNLFDGLLILSQKIRQRGNSWIKLIAEKISEFNLWIHWFVRSSTFCAKWNRQETSVEKYKGKPVYSWKYGWYNLVPLIVGLAALCWSLTL